MQFFPEEYRTFLCPVVGHGQTVVSETGPLNGKGEPCPAKASTDTNKVSPVTLPVPPEATMASHKELSQFASPFLNPVTLSPLPRWGWEPL